MKHLLGLLGLTTNRPTLRDCVIVGLATASLGSIGAMAVIGNDSSALPTLLTLGAVSCVSALALRVVLGNSSEAVR